MIIINRTKGRTFEVDVIATPSEKAILKAGG